MSAYGYERVSTGRQAQDGESLPSQGEKITAYCEFMDIPLHAIYWDPGISGTTIEKRPGVQALIQAVEEGRVSDVVVYKLDRLGRNTIELLNMIEDFEQRGVTFHSICEKIDTSTAMGKFFLRILAALAEMVRDQIAENTRNVMRTMKQNGQKVSSRAPFGYKYVNGLAVEDPQEMRAMEIIQKLRLEGHSLRKISTRLAKDGFVSRSGRPYAAASVRAMLAL